MKLWSKIICGERFETIKAQIFEKCPKINTIPYLDIISTIFTTIKLKRNWIKSLWKIVLFGKINFCIETPYQRQLIFIQEKRLIEAKEQIENLERDVKRLKANQVKFSLMTLESVFPNICSYFHNSWKLGLFLNFIFCWPTTGKG